MAGQPEPSQADGTVTPTEARPGPDWSSASRESARGVIMITVTMIEEVRAGSGLGRWQPGPPRPGWPGPGVPLNPVILAAGRRASRTRRRVRRPGPIPWRIEWRFRCGFTACRTRRERGGPRRGMTRPGTGEARPPRRRRPAAPQAGDRDVRGGRGRRSWEAMSRGVQWRATPSWSRDGGRGGRVCDGDHVDHDAQPRRSVTVTASVSHSDGEARHCTAEYG